ncbi:hypothetical protein PHSC3_000047 [Chlamydiales bacterium STE3]|nr:hypothetical protein PHSC3_000047 [Chlamydiales bacterium STE3]
MTDSKNEENKEEWKLKSLVKRFDPKLKLAQIPGLTYEHLTHQIQKIQELLNVFVNKWKPKITSFQTQKSELVDSVISYFDQQRYHLNHPFGLARLNTPKDSRRGLFFYSYPFNEFLAYETAKELGMSERMLETSIAVIDSNDFVDILGNLSASQPHFQEKICSRQKLIPQAQDPFQFTLSFFKNNNNLILKTSLENYHEQIDPKSFEDVFILSWIIGEMEGSANKYLLIPKNGKMAFIKKSCLTCFSSNYFETDSFLIAFTHIHQPLSEEGKAAILNFKEETIINMMRYFGKSEGAISCFKDRVRRIKEAASKKNCYLRDLAPIGLRKEHWKVESFLIKLRDEGIAFT